MSSNTLAIASCRVSSDEQLSNNSLSRQKQAVLKAAEELDVTIPENYWWSGSVSSKRGGNVARKDLAEMLEVCKKDKRVKYLIVDEPDRFMRSINEAAYFEVKFEMMGVKVWYASDPQLNKGDLSAKLIKFTKYLSAEGSNEERQRKSIAGQTAALLEGRYPFVPKPGYKRGYEKGIPELHEIRGPLLQDALLGILENRVTPTQALVEFNKSDFTKNHSTYKMDKFRKIVTDPFYAGIVEIDKQVKVRNENGLHEALITKEQHVRLVRIMNGKGKLQSGPRKNGNPLFPLSNMVSCDMCHEKSNGRIVGFVHGNGKPNSKVYEKYRCRSCKRYQHRQDLHTKVVCLFKEHPMTPSGMHELIDALDIVWKQREDEAAQEAITIKHKISHHQQTIANQIEAVTDPENNSIKNEILNAITVKQETIAELEAKLDELKCSANEDKEDFMQFAISFVDDMGRKFFEISKENSVRCKQIIFPGGFHIDESNRVYTKEVSILYRLVPNKKDLSESEKSLLVRVRGL